MDHMQKLMQRSHEFEPFKAIVLDKWKGIPELDDFVAYVVPQWFVGMFSNWQIFRSLPGFANTNNPLEYEECG